MANGKLTTKNPARQNDASKASFVKKNVKSFVDQATFNQRVQEKAYELYLNRGGAPGNELADWFEAEKIIASENK